MADMRIGELARRTGVSAPTIRYYEQAGLLAPASRGDGGQRRYGENEVRRLTFIRRCRELGFSIAQVRALGALTRDGNRFCLEARDLAHRHLLDVRARLEQLSALEQGISRFVEDCELNCTGGPGPDCDVLGRLHQPQNPASCPGTAADAAGTGQP